MGDYSDMMLDGTLCEGCGAYLGDQCGHVRYCKDCKPEKQKTRSLVVTKKDGKKALAAIRKEESDFVRQYARRRGEVQ